MTYNIPIPRYKCHKEVYALKISAIEFDKAGNAKIAPKNHDYAVFTSELYRSKFKGSEDDLGYWVQYEDGYDSWSPTEAFENGYTRI